MSFLSTVIALTIASRTSASVFPFTGIGGTSGSVSVPSSPTVTG